MSQSMDLLFGVLSGSDGSRTRALCRLIMAGVCPECRVPRILQRLSGTILRIGCRACRWTLCGERYRRHLDEVLHVCRRDGRISQHALTVLKEAHAENGQRFALQAGMLERLSQHGSVETGLLDVIGWIEPAYTLNYPLLSNLLGTQEADEIRDCMPPIIGWELIIHDQLSRHSADYGIPATLQDPLPQEDILLLLVLRNRLRYSRHVAPLLRTLVENGAPIEAGALSIESRPFDRRRVSWKGLTYARGSDYTQRIRRILLPRETQKLRVFGRAGGSDALSLMEVNLSDQDFDVDVLHSE